MVASGLGLLFGVLGLSTTSWKTSTSTALYSYSGLSYTYGLWKACLSSLCTEITPTPAQGYLFAVRTFVMLGFLIAIGASAVLALRLFVESMMTIQFAKISAGLAIGAGGCTFLGVVIYAGKFAESAISVLGITVGTGVILGYSFGLSVIAAICMASSGGLILYDMKQTFTETTTTTTNVQNVSVVEKQSTS